MSQWKKPTPQLDPTGHFRPLATTEQEDAEDIRDAEAALREEGEITLSAVKAEYGLRLARR